MTTKQDWLFRGNYLRMQANHLEARAKALDLEAFHYRCHGDSCLKIAEDMNEPSAPSNNENDSDGKA